MTCWVQQTAPPSTPPRVIDAENDFPIANVTRVLVGSAHAVISGPQALSQLEALLGRLVADCHEPALVPAIEVQDRTHP